MLPHLPCMDPIETIGLLCKRNANKLNARFSTSTLVVSSKVRFKVREESPGMSSDKFAGRKGYLLRQGPRLLGTVYQNSLAKHLHKIISLQEQFIIRHEARWHATSPCSNSESRFLVRYSKLFGIFLLKLAADVESNITSATSSGIPPGFGCRSRTSFLGKTCICRSDFVSPEDILTSTRMKSASTDTFPKKAPVDAKEDIFNVGSKKRPSKYKFVGTPQTI